MDNNCAAVEFPDFTRFLLPVFGSFFFQFACKGFSFIHSLFFFFKTCISRLVYCLQNGLPLDLDVYDLAEWCCLAELGELSMDIYP